MNRLLLYIYIALFPVIGMKYKLFPVSGYETIFILCGLSLVLLVLSLPSYKNPADSVVHLSPASCFLLLFYGWAALGYFYTVDADNGFPIAIEYLGAACLYLALLLFFRNEAEVKNLLWIFLVSAGVLAFVAIAQQFDVPYLPLVNRVSRHSSSIFYDKNFLGTYLLMMIPLACLLSFSSSGKMAKGGAYWIYILLFTALWLSGSRAAQLVGIIQVTAIMIYLNRENERGGMKALMLGFLISAIFYQSITHASPVPEMGERTGLYQLVEGDKNSIVRILCWKVGWNIFADHWLLGAGPWSYAALFPQYLDTMDSPWTAETMVNIPHAHNLYLQIACESGLIGLFFFTGVLVISGRRVWLLMRQSLAPVRGKVFFISLSVAGFLLHNGVEVNWIVSTFIYHFTVLVFLLDFYARQQFTAPEVKAPRRRKVLLSVAGGCVGLSLIFLCKFYVYERIMFHEVLEVQSAAELEDPVSRASAMCPRCVFPHLALTAVLLEEYGKTQEPQLLIRAENILQRAAETKSINPGYFLYLSQVLIFQNRPDEAEEALHLARKYRTLRDSADQLLKLIETKKSLAH